MEVRTIGLLFENLLLLSDQELCGGHRCDAQEGMIVVFKLYLEQIKESTPFRGVSIILNCNVRKLGLFLLVLFVVENSDVLLGMQY
jgi:hypothetical protein